MSTQSPHCIRFLSFVISLNMYMSFWFFMNLFKSLRSYLYRFTSFRIPEHTNLILRSFLWWLKSWQAFICFMLINMMRNSKQTCEENVTLTKRLALMLKNVGLVIILVFACVKRGQPNVDANLGAPECILIMRLANMFFSKYSILVRSVLMSLAELHLQASADLSCAMFI